MLSTPAIETQIPVSLGLTFKTSVIARVLGLDVYSRLKWRIAALGKAPLHPQRLRHPIRRQRPELVADVEADVVAFRDRPPTRSAPRRSCASRSPSAGEIRRSPAPNTTSSGHLMFCERPSSVSSLPRSCALLDGLRNASARGTPPATPSASSAAPCPSRTARSWRCSALSRGSPAAASGA